MTKAEFKQLPVDEQITKAAEQKSFWQRTKSRLESRERSITQEEKTAINQLIVADVDAVDLVS